MSSDIPQRIDASSAAPEVSVIIVTHNSRPTLLQCLDSLPEACSGLRCELVLVDNASTDGSADITLPGSFIHQVIRHDKNLGFARACNAGADMSIADYLLFLNPDVTLDPRSISTLLQVARTHPRAGLITGRLRYPDGTFQATCRQFPTMRNLLRSRGSMLYRWFGSKVDSQSRYTLTDFDEVTEVPAVAAALVMIDRMVFKKLRGFDSRFFLYMEDTDLSLRVRNTGLVNVFVPHAGGVHALGEGSRIGRARRGRLQSVAVWKYFLKHQPNGLSLFVLPVLLCVNWLLSLVTPKSKVPR